MDKSRSLKKEILQLLITFSILVITIIGSVALVNLYNLKINITKHNQNLVLKQVKNEIDNIIIEINNISNYMKENYFQDTLILKTLIETNSNISSILVLDSEGILKDFYAKKNQNIFKGFDYSNKAYFRNIDEVYDTYWSDVFLSTIDEEPSVCYSFRMKNNDVGVIIIKLTELSNFLYRFKNVDGSHMIRIYDNNGTTIINPDAQYLVQQRFNASSSQVFTELINKTQSYTQKVYKSEVLDIKEYGAYDQVNTTKWNIVVRENSSLLIDSIFNIIITVLLTIVFFLFTSVYLSFKISKRIFKSFDSLQKNTSEIANGNYALKTKKFYYSEFNDLLKSFNKMKIEIDKREDNLEKSLDSFKYLFNSTMEAIILHKNHICIDVNNVAVEMFGYKNKEELIGKNFIELVASSHKDIVKENYLRDMEPYEIDFIKEDGSKISTLAQGKYIDLNSQRLKVSAIIDITELKQKDQLLFQQSKMASMGEMIGNIAHQWRQPLSIISTCASSMKFEKELGVLKEESMGESLDVILDNTQYLSKTIDDFRNFFKSNKKIEKFNIKDVLDKSLKLLNSSIKNNSITVELKLDDENVIYEGYSNEFIQVIINLINNSKDAFLMNEVKNRYIRIQNSNDEYSYKLSFTDNAGGIDEKIIEKIFDPYFTTKHQAQGTGIGLYMSHQIIADHMNGDITVYNKEIVFENKKYKGACFTIEIPKYPNANITYMI